MYDDYDDYGDVDWADQDHRDELSHERDHGAGR